MYAIVTTGAKQYKVAKGDLIDVEKLAGEPGDVVELDVLLFSDDKKVVADPADVEKLKVSAQIVDQYKGEKQLIFKFKKRKRYHRTRGHRQNLTRLEIVGLPGDAKPAKKASSAAKAADKVEEKAEKAPAKKTAAKNPAAKKETAPKKEKAAAKKPAAKKTTKKSE